MRLAFWRREPEPIAWYHIDRAVPYAMAAEMATWPEPIDVIREALGLAGRAQAQIEHWMRVTRLPDGSRRTEGGTRRVGPAGTGNPIHDQALRRARGF